jgi:hypothetical protein
VLTWSNFLETSVVCQQATLDGQGDFDKEESKAICQNKGIGFISSVGSALCRANLFIHMNRNSLQVALILFEGTEQFTNCDIVFGEKRGMEPIVRPESCVNYTRQKTNSVRLLIPSDVFDSRYSKAHKFFLLLNIEENSCGRCKEEKAARPTVDDISRA